jgi:hypothetical protein
MSLPENLFLNLPESLFHAGNRALHVMIHFDLGVQRSNFEEGKFNRSSVN